MQFHYIFGSHDDSDYEYNIPRQWYIQKLFNPSDVHEPDDPNLPFIKKSEHLLTIEDFKYALSSRYQHTKYDPYGLQGTDADRHAFRPIGFQRNQELSILQIRNDVPKEIAGVQWLAFGPNTFNGIAPYYTNVLDTPSVYRDTKEHFDIKNMYWLTQAIATIVDEHPFRYSASVEELEQQTLAAGRHILLETDAEAEKLTGEELQKKLHNTNEQTAKAAYDAAMKCFGDCVETGALQIKLNY